MKALILSGGTGTRLRPFSYTNAKQLLPVANKPILFHIIEKVAKTGIRDIGIIVGDTREEIKSAVGTGDRWNVNITYIRQPLPLGLAHAVKTASSFIHDSYFLMILGDNLLHMDLDGLIDNFKKSRSNATILLHKVADPSEFGVAVVEDDHIVKLVEKPAEHISNLVITGIYVFDETIFTAIENISPSQRGELEITDAIQNLVDTDKKVTYELTQGWWKDTGKLPDILEANRLVLDEIESGFHSGISKDSACCGKILIGKNVAIEHSTIYGPAVIGDDSVIADSYLGPYASIGRSVRVINCKIENCIILENTKIENIDKKISKSFVGKYVTIKGTDAEPDPISLFIGDSSEITM